MRGWKQLCLILVLVSLLAACAAPAAPQESGQTSDTAPEAITLTLLTQGDSWDPNNVYKPAIEEAVGITLAYDMVPSSNYLEKRNVVMASGDYPDVIRVNPTESVYVEYVEGNLLRPLNDLLERYPAVRDQFSEEMWQANTYSDGNIYHIPRITGVYPQTIAYRKDWSDALGIAQPTNTEEFTAMLAAFQEEDPGNVGDALIPFVPNRLDDVSWLNPILSPFGCNYMTWIPDPNNPDQLVLSATLPCFQEGLTYARALYDANLMDPTWGVSTERGLFKFYAGIVGATTDWPQFDHLRTEAIHNAFPEASPEIAYIVGLQGPDGTQGGPAITPNAQSLGTALTIAATDEEADAFFRMLNWQYTDGYEMMTLGVEGVTFDVGEDGIARRRGRDAVLENNPEYDLYMLDRVFFAEPPAYFDYSRENPSWNDVDDEMFSYVSSVLDEVNEVAQINYLVNTDDPAIRNNLQPITDLVEEFAIRAIISPNFDMEAEFASFTTTLEQNNLAEVTEAVNRLNDIDTINAMVGQ